MTINNNKWLLISAYKPPSMSNGNFTNDITKTLDKAYMYYENILIAGDLNFDLLQRTKGRTLTDICDTYDLTNTVKSPTCFTKNSTIISRCIFDK